MPQSLNISQTALNRDVLCVGRASFPFADATCRSTNYFVAMAIFFYQTLMPGWRFRLRGANGIDEMGSNSSSVFARLSRNESQFTGPLLFFSEHRFNASNSVLGPWTFTHRALLYRESLLTPQLVMGIGYLFPLTLLLPFATSSAYPHIASAIYARLGQPPRQMSLCFLSLCSILIRNVIRARIVNFYHRPAYATRVRHSCRKTIPVLSEAVAQAIKSLEQLVGLSRDGLRLLTYSDDSRDFVLRQAPALESHVDVLGDTSAILQRLQDTRFLVPHTSGRDVINWQTVRCFVGL